MFYRRVCRGPKDAPTLFNTVLSLLDKDSNSHFILKEDLFNILQGVGQCDKSSRCRSGIRVGILLNDRSP